MSSKHLTIGIAALAVLAAAGILYTLFRPADRVTAPEQVPITGPERAEDARAVIADFQDGGNTDYDTAFSRAQEFQSAGQLADAQLLYFYAARAEHGPSAFALATMNDPLHHSPQTSLLAEPDPFQAYRWYTVARDHGMSEAAGERLEALREWAQGRADTDDAAAERLLLQWE